jgi:hypothetical protein
MAEVTQGLDFVICYIDDLLIASHSLTEHLSHLKTLFSRLDKFGVTINIEKWVFAADKVTFLGYQISKKGIEPIPDRVNAMKIFPRPTTIHELRRFFGMINFYHRFIPHAALSLAKLNQLTAGNKAKKSRALVDWSDDATRSFETARGLFETACLLSFPDPSCPLRLCTDESDLGVAGALEQLTSTLISASWFLLGSVKCDTTPILF